MVPDIAQNLAKPNLRAPLSSATATVAFQSPPAPVYQPPPTSAYQPWEQHAPLLLLTQMKGSYFSQKEMVHNSVAACSVACLDTMSMAVWQLKNTTGPID